MIRVTLVVTILLFLHQAWTQNRWARPEKRHQNDPISLNLPAVVLNTALRSADSVYWIRVNTDSGLLHAAIAMPAGKGPFPAVLILHGTHGFAEEYVQLARRIAANGVVGIAACWFAGRQGAGIRFITPIECADAPPLVELPGADRFRKARQTIDSLVRKVRALPRVRSDQLVLFGHSRGAGAALDYVMTHPGSVQGVILNSCGYPPEVTGKAAAGVGVRVLVLHGTADSPADGGSTVTSIDRARQFEAALRTAGKPIEVKYYAGGHNGLFSDSAQFEDSVNRITRFVRGRVAK